MTKGGDPTLQTVVAQQQRHGERLSVLETQMKDIKTQERSIEETLDSQFSFLCKHLGIPVPVVPSTNFTPDPGSTYAAKSYEETKSTDEAPTDSLELELIPNFFFMENDDVDLLHGQFEDNSKLDINCFSELSPVTIDRIKDIEMQFWVNYLEKNCVISEYLMDLFFLHNKLLHMDSFGLHFDYNRFLFDRGKFTVILSLTYEKLALQSLLILGYNSNFWFLHSFPRLCVTGFAFLGAKKMFVHRPDRDRCLLLLLFARVITFEISCENLASSKYLIIIDSKLNYKDSVTLLFDDTRSLFDRGKEIELNLRTSCFTKCTEIVSQIDVCLKFFPGYYRVSVPELIHEHGVSSTQLLGKMIQIDIVYKLFFRHGVRLHTFSMKYILLAFRTGDIGDVFMWCLRMVRMWRKVYFLLHLKYGSLHELEVQILESLVVLGIHIKSLEIFSEFIMFILHQGFLYLQLGIHSPLMLLIHTKHCNLFEMDAIRKIHALFVKMLLQNHVSWFNWIMQFVLWRCFTLRFVTRLVYDCGKEFEQSWVCFGFYVAASNYMKYTCSLILHNQVLVQRPTLMYGYQSELLSMYSYLLVFVTTDDCGASGYLSVKKAQRNNVYETTLTSLFGIWLRSIVWSLNGGGTHALLLLQHGLVYDTGDTVGGFWKRGSMTEQFMCYCYMIFILSSRYTQPRPFNTFVIHSRSSKVIFNCRFLGRGCFYNCFAYTRTLFDCEKTFKLIMWGSYFLKWEFEFRFVFDMGLNLVVKCHRVFLHELVYKIGYWSDWFFGALIVYLLANGGSEFFLLLLKCGSLEVSKCVLKEIFAPIFLIITTGAKIYMAVSEQLKMGLALYSSLILGREGHFDGYMWPKFILMWYKDDGWAEFIPLTMVLVSLTTVKAQFLARVDDYIEQHQVYFPLLFLLFLFVIVLPDVVRNFMTVFLQSRECF